jgi:hypothetical protein
VEYVSKGVLIEGYVYHWRTLRRSIPSSPSDEKERPVNTLEESLKPYRRSRRRVSELTLNRPKSRGRQLIGGRGVECVCIVDVYMSLDCPWTASVLISCATTFFVHHQPISQALQAISVSSSYMSGPSDAENATIGTKTMHNQLLWYLQLSLRHR